MKPAPETADTFELLQTVSRGEERITVADSDIFAAARPFAPNIASPCKLAERQPIAWGVRKDNNDLKATLDAFLVEHALTEFKGEPHVVDLPEIQKRKVLRVLTRNSSSTFFIYKGEPLGFEYELAQGFAKSLGVRLEIIVPPSREALFQYLDEGRGDLIAAGLTKTAERESKYAFSAPYQFVNELLVVPADDTATRSLADLKGKKIAVRRELLPDARGFSARARLRNRRPARGPRDRGRSRAGGRAQDRSDAGRFEHRADRAHLQRCDPLRWHRRRPEGSRLGKCARTSPSSKPPPIRISSSCTRARSTT